MSGDERAFTSSNRYVTPRFPMAFVATSL